MVDTYAFPSSTCFLIHMEFYSEGMLSKLREGGRHFIVSVPEHTVISKAVLFDISFTDHFIERNRDKDGHSHHTVILYKQMTVAELEEIYQRILDEEDRKLYENDRKRYEEEIRQRREVREPKLRERKIRRSEFPDDQVIVYRNCDMHDQMLEAFRERIGKDQDYTWEKLEEIGPTLGLLILRSNYAPKEAGAEYLYCCYKKRWKITTHYNVLEDAMEAYGIGQRDYYSLQGLSFLTVPLSQIKKAVSAGLKNAEKCIGSISIAECIVKAGALKLTQHLDKTWHAHLIPSEMIELYSAMGVNVAEDIRKLEQNIY